MHFARALEGKKPLPHAWLSALRTCLRYCFRRGRSAIPIAELAIAVTAPSGPTRRSILSRLALHGDGRSAQLLGNFSRAAVGTLGRLLTPDEFLKADSAFGAKVFVDRHKQPPLDPAGQQQ